MRQCGECSLCCKVARNAAIGKPSNVMCRHCDLGRGCSIYAARPQVCADFKCRWLRDESVPDAWRPDRAHLYVNDDPRKNTADVAQVLVDTDYPDAWREGIGEQVVAEIVGRGSHAVVVCGDQVNFVCGAGAARPEKLVLEWLM